MEIGNKYFNWKIIAFQNYGVICECVCGKQQWIAKNKLLNGLSTQCRICSNKIKAINNKKHGFGVRKKRPRIYGIWNLMKRRCLNPNDSQYHLYGGRGIKICEKWLKFEGFLEDMGEPLENYFIDRIDCNGNYELNNCRWVSPQESARNTRSCIYFEIDGKKLTQKQIYDQFKINHTTLKKYREKLGNQEALELLLKRKLLIHKI